MPSALDTQTSWAAFLEEMKRPGSLPEMNWPNFLVVGAQKAASTSLYTQLRRHPEVFLPGHKELRLFQPEHPDSGTVEQYRTFYADAAGFRAIGEITPFYLPEALVPPRIHEVSPRAKIIIVLRDPVERAYSHYLNAREVNVGASEPARTFREALRRYGDPSAKDWERSQRYIEHGLYYEGVLRYMETFGASQVLVLVFDHLVRNPNEVFGRIARHIGVDPGIFARMDLSENSHPYRVPKFAAIRWLQRTGLTTRVPRSIAHAAWPIFFNLKKPPLDPESRRQLQAIYDPDIARLEQLLGYTIPELRKSWI